jgi:hypothetical protein
MADQRTLQLLKKITQRLLDVEKKSKDNEIAVSTLANNTQKIITKIERVVNLSPKQKEKKKWVF